MNDVQRRYVARNALPITLEQRADGALPKITGYASVFYRDGEPDTEFEIWPAEFGFPRVVERIMPGAFDRALKEDDVRGLFNHDAAAILGRMSAGTLKLSVDARGLKYEIDPPDTQLARDLIQSLKRGDISGSSFAFTPRATTYRSVKDGEKSAEIWERTDVQLYDVGPVTYPAYAGATSGVRSDDADSVRREVEAQRAARELDELAVTLVLIDLDSGD